MPKSVATEYPIPMSRREAGAPPRRRFAEDGERTVHPTAAKPDGLVDGIAPELRAALDAIPAGSVTAHTAGALRVSGPPRSIENERAAFEWAVADENARPTEG